MGAAYTTASALRREAAFLSRARAALHTAAMSAPYEWNHPAWSWTEASHGAERRVAQTPERRSDPQRRLLGERRSTERRVLSALLRL
jgi:hypothetical protein